MLEKKVLLVDDEVAIRNLFQLSLEKEGMTVFTAGGVIEALQLIHDLGFDVAIIDLHLKDGDGLELAHRIGRMGRATKVLAMSSYSHQPESVEALKKAGIDFYSKLEPLSELVRMISFL